MKHTILLLLTLGLGCFARAGDDHDHGHSHADIKVPATLPEVRAAMAEQQKKLAAKDAKAAHATTDVLTAYVRAIPGKTQNLDEATLLRVTGMANNAAKAWGQAAHDAEHGDYEKAQREAAKAEASFRLLEARLPRD
jgi:hypothetical protein